MKQEGTHVPLEPVYLVEARELIVAFGTLYVVWGSTYLAIRIGLQQDLPPALFAGARLLPAGLIMLGFARWRGSELRIPWREYRIVAVVGLFLLCGGMYGMFLAEQYIPSGLAALLVALLPLWIAIAESAMPDMHRPSTLGYLGLVIGFSGLGILMWPRLSDVSGTASELLGIGILIVGTWLWCTGSIISKRKPVKTDALVATGYEMATAGVVLLAVGAVSGEIPRFTLTPIGSAALLYLILMGSCVAFTAFVWLLPNAPASKVMTYAYVNPVVAVFLGWLVLREPLDWWMAAGMIVIIAGVVLTTAAPTRPPRHPVDGTVEEPVLAE